VWAHPAKIPDFQTSGQSLPQGETLRKSPGPRVCADHCLRFEPEVPRNDQSSRAATQKRLGVLLSIGHTLLLRVPCLRRQTAGNGNTSAGGLAACSDFRCRLPMA